MEVLFFGVAVLLTVCFAVGWVILLCLPLVALTGATVGGVVEGVKGTRGLRRSLARSAARGILCVDGLVTEPALRRRLRFEIGRVLELAAPDTRPRACACVKESGGAYLGVLRVFNTKGHYLLRASGETAAAVARRFVAALQGYESDFPAREGARRIACPECDPKTCPLRRSKRERALALA